MARAANLAVNGAGANGRQRKVVVLEARVVAGSGGGPDKTILNSPRFLWSAGYETLCLYMRPPNDPGFESLRQKASTWRAPLLEVDDRGSWDWRVVSQVLTLCRRYRVAIWHGHDYKSNALGLLLRRFWPMRLVTTVHGWVHETCRTPLYYWVDRLCLPRYERVIGVSPDLVEKSVACGVWPERCLLVENAIDTEEFVRIQDPSEAKAKLGIPRDRFVVGAVGRLSPEKGFDLLIRAIHQMAQASLDVTLLLIGEGDARAGLEHLIQELNCGERVRLLGYQSDARPFYEAMDAFALSSLREGLPNVLLEAMSLEVPVVATRIAGVPRLVTHEENGLLVEPGSAPELASGLTRIYKDKALAERLRLTGRQTIEGRYSFRARMEKIRNLYDELLKDLNRST